MNIREPELTIKEKAADSVEKIFFSSDNSGVATTVIYTANGTTFYYDRAKKIKVEAADMFKLFINGVVAVKSDVYYKPTSCTAAGVITFPFPA